MTPVKEMTECFNRSTHLQSSMGGGASKNKAGARKKGEIDRMVNMARSTSIKSQKKAAVALEKIRCAQTD